MRALILILIWTLVMADDLAAALQGSTGSWDDPGEAQQGLLRALLDYGKALPGRAMVGFGEEGRRLQELGRAGPKEQARDMFGLGHLVNGYDAVREGRYLPAAGNAVLGLADLAGPARSKAVGAADAALQAWDAALKARPAQLTERAAQELEKLLPPSGKFNAYSKAHKQRIRDADYRAERAIPAPEVPGGRSADETQRMLETLYRTWPGNVGAGAIAAGGASGIPGVLLDDARGALDPLHAMYRNAVEERRAETEQRQMPVTAGAQPEVNHYWDQLDRPRHERNVHAGFAGGMGLAGGPTAYAAGKTVPWAATRAMPGFLGLAADAAMIHPALGIPIAAAALAPFAVPAGLGWGTWELAKGTEGQIHQAMKKHDEAKALQPIIRQLLENYRDRPDAPSLTPDRSY